MRAEDRVSRIRVYRPGGRGGGEQTGRGSDRERQRPRLGTDLGVTEQVQSAGESEIVTEDLGFKFCSS